MNLKVDGEMRSIDVGDIGGGQIVCAPYELDLDLFRHLLFLPMDHLTHEGLFIHPGAQMNFS